MKEQMSGIHEEDLPDWEGAPGSGVWYLGSWGGRLSCSEFSDADGTLAASGKHRG